MALTQEEKSLLDIQDIDLKLAQLDTQLEKAPHKQRIALMRAKAAEGQKRLALIEKASAELKKQATTLQDEIDELDQRMQIHQATMQQSSDHRAVENLSKELEGLMKQKEKKENTTLQLMEKRSEFDAAHDDTAAKTKQLQEIEAQELAAYKAYYQELKSARTTLLKEREVLAGNTSSAILARYEKTRDVKNGIGVSLYEAGKCGACSVMVPDAKRAEIETTAGIQACPNCKRLLIVEK